MDKLLEAKYREGLDSREQPLYTTREAASYLGIGKPTLETWFFGRSYPTKLDPKKPWLPVFSPADPDLKLLSFFNLAEAHVLAATRYDHKVPFWAVRDAITNVIDAVPHASRHPLNFCSQTGLENVSLSTPQASFPAFFSGRHPSS